MYKTYEGGPNLPKMLSPVMFEFSHMVSKTLKVLKIPKGSFINHVDSWGGGGLHTCQEGHFNLKKIGHEFWVNFFISDIILVGLIAINNFWDNGP